MIPLNLEKRQRMVWHAQALCLIILMLKLPKTDPGHIDRSHIGSTFERQFHRIWYTLVLRYTVTKYVLIARIEFHVKELNTQNFEHTEQAVVFSAAFWLLNVFNFVWELFVNFSFMPRYLTPRSLSVGRCCFSRRSFAAALALNSLKPFRVKQQVSYARTSSGCGTGVAIVSLTPPTSTRR